MKDYLDDLKGELRRADQLFYVSLKYTRTVDIIRLLIKRLLNAFDFGMTGLLVKTKRRRKNLEIPEQPRKVCELIKEIFPQDTKLIEFIEFYLELRDIYQAKYTRREEYRRNVTMISKLQDGIIIEVNIDLLLEFFNKTKEFLEYLEEKYY